MISHHARLILDQPARQARVLLSKHAVVKATHTKLVYLPLEETLDKIDEVRVDD